MNFNPGESGESVYTTTEHSVRAGRPYYLTTREIIAGLLSSNPEAEIVVIDIGSGDGAVSGPLTVVEGTSNSKVICLELDHGSARSAQSEYPDMLVAEGDIRNLPFKIEENIHKVILLIDILEHLTWNEAIDALKYFHQTMGEHTVIVSMPNISVFSPLTIMELGKMLLKGKRPPRGLFDRTHQILTDIYGHQRLFSEAGYDVKHRYISCLYEGVSGSWDWKRDITKYDKYIYGFKHPVLKWLYEMEVKFASEILRFLKGEVNPQIVRDTVEGYQGLYVLSPIKNS